MPTVDDNSNTQIRKEERRGNVTAIASSGSDDQARASKAGVPADESGHVRLNPVP